jgi:hypothetical protein
MVNELEDESPAEGKPTSGLAALAAASVFPGVHDSLVKAAGAAVAPSISAFQAFVGEVSHRNTQTFADAAGATLEGISHDILKVSPLTFDYESLSPKIISDQVVDQLVPSFALFREFQRAQFAETFASFAKVLDTAWPPNWHGAQRPDQLKLSLESMLLDEGLCLAWVPPTPVLERLFAASSRQDRRSVIGRSWKYILDASERELDAVTKPVYRHYVSFARYAVDAVRTGNHQAGQALAANLLDTVLQQVFSTDSRKIITNQKSRFDIGKYPLQLSLVLGGIWGSYLRYQPRDGDKIPTQFSRHASAHGVSARQYSRVNATLSIMHVVALLRAVQPLRNRK